MISLLWAQTPSGVIGYQGKLPWDIKEEMQHFINYTKNKAVFMGRNTWESLKLKPLPNRTNFVLTSKPINISDPNLIVVNNLKTFLKTYENSQEELIIIGGSKVYESVLDVADRLVVSYIKKEYLGDTYAPKIDLNQFIVIGQENFTDFEVITYERKK